MVTFEVKDMTCGHCVNAITQAVKALDSQAQLSIDLATHRVVVEPATADTAGLVQAIRVAGYAAVVVDGAAEHAAVGEATARSGCCCGQR